MERSRSPLAGAQFDSRDYPTHIACLCCFVLCTTVNGLFNQHLLTTNTTTISSDDLFLVKDLTLVDCPACDVGFAQLESVECYKIAQSSTENTIHLHVITGCLSCPVNSSARPVNSSARSLIWLCLTMTLLQHLFVCLSAYLFPFTITHTCLHPDSVRVAAY